MTQGGKSSEWIMTMPSFAWLVLFFVIPTLIVYAFAFRQEDIYGGVGQGWTLSNIYNLFTPGYLVILYRTVALAILTTLISLVIALPMGYYMALASEKVRHLVLLLTILPFWSSFIVRIFAWKSLLHPDGMVKKLLVALHFVNDDAILLYNSGTVLLVMVYSYLPFAILPIYAASSKFNFQLLEAAMDLGMTRLQTFFKVFLPNIRTGIITAQLMVLIPSLGAYVIPDVVGGTKSEMIGNKIVQRTFIDRNLPEASALSALLSLAVLLPMGIIAVVRPRNRPIKPEKKGD